RGRSEAPTCGWTETPGAAAAPARAAASDRPGRRAGPGPARGEPSASLHHRAGRIGDGAIEAARRDDAERDAAVGIDKTADGLPQRRGRDRVIPLEIAIEVGRVAEKDVVGVELIGLAAESADRLQPED